MSAGAYGENPYGSDPYQVLPDAEPVGVAYGGTAYGDSAYGGSVVDNTIGGLISHNFEPVPTAEAEISSGNVLVAGVTEPAPEGSAEMLAISYVVHVAEQLPLAEAEINNPGIVVAGVTEQLPAADLVIENPAMSFHVNEDLPESSGSVLSEAFIAFDVSDLLPQISNDVRHGNVLPVIVSEPAPMADLLLEERFYINAAVVEPLPLASSQTIYLVANNFTVAEPLPSVESTMAGGGLVTGSAIESQAEVSASIGVNGFNAVEQKPVAQAVIRNGRILNGATSEVKPTASASLSGDRVIRANVVEQAPAASLVMAAPSGMAVNVTEQAPSLQSRMVRGATVRGNIIDITPLLSGKIIQDSQLTGQIVEPVPVGRAVFFNAITIDIVDGDPTAWTINTEIMATTEYDSFRFDSMACIGGKCYGIRGDGLYLLSGDTDEGVLFESEFLTGQDDADQDRLKSVPLFHADVTGVINAVVQFDDDVAEAGFNGRAKFGRGLRANRLAFGVRSVEGSRFKVNSLEPVIEILKKRA